MGPHVGATTREAKLTDKIRMRSRQLPIAAKLPRPTLALPQPRQLPRPGAVRDLAYLVAEQHAAVPWVSHLIHMDAEP